MQPIVDDELLLTDRPNIVLITADQLQAFALGSYGNPDVKTPHLDALAASGLRFEVGISNAPVCMAGRSSLISGQPNRVCTGGVSNVSYPCGKRGSYPMPEYPPPTRLHFPDQTLPECLQTLGYTTAAIGKWHMYVWPDQFGFDHYVIPRTHHAHSAQSYVEDSGHEFVPEGWSVEFETDRAVRYLDQHGGRDEPFFLYLNYSPPHGPISDCPERYARMYDPASLTLRPNADEDAFDDHMSRVYRWDYRYYELQLPYTMQPGGFSLRDIHAAYYGNVTWVDDQIGRLVATLKSSGRLEDTLIVFTADHGDNLGSHGRHGKGLPYDESLRIPMILSRPGTLDPRVEAGCTAGLTDLAPTLIAAAGGAVPSHMSGADLLGDDQPDVQIVEIRPGDLVARSTRFTAHLHVDKSPDRLAFYDNLEDPYQERNLAGQDVFAEEQDRLFGLLEAFNADTAITPQPDYGFRTAT